MVSWDHYDGLGSAIIGAVNSGLSGFTMTHSDIGGYTSLKEPIPFRSENCNNNLVYNAVYDLKILLIKF